MESETNGLPHFVRKQVEKASQELIAQLKPLSIIVETHGNRVLVIEEKPHPVKPECIRSPLALLDHQEDGWHLLFRSSQGGWQPLPNDYPTKSPSSKFEVLVSDDYGVFWRQ
jgi:hypothetical protein